VKRLARMGAIAVRRLPGGRPEVDVLELKRVIRNSIKPAVATAV
jgi:hypothetical protein